MFVYIKWFSGISFILVVLSVILGGHYFREITYYDLIAIAENNNKLIAQGFINTTWKEYRNQAQSPAERYHKTETLYNFSRQVSQYFEHMPVAGVNVYATDGRKLVSIDRLAMPGKNNNYLHAVAGNASAKEGVDNDAFRKALTGMVTSATLKDAAIAKPGTAQTDGFIVKTFIPIMRDNSLMPEVTSYNEPGQTNIACTDINVLNCVEGIIEIRYNLTGQWKNLCLFRQIATFGVIALFIALIFILFFTSKRAEAMIIRQYETGAWIAAETVTAQAENQDKSQFLANVSHELRTPLNAIVGFSEYIKLERSGLLANPKYREYINDIYGSGSRLLNLINDILDYSKAEAGKLEIDVGEVDVTKALRNAVRAIAPRAEAAQVRLIEEMPGDHFVIKTDGKKLRQILLNLFTNAVKFTPPGGMVMVTAWQNKKDNSLSIEVRDSGIGMAPQDIPRAMAPFGQLDSNIARKYEGTGLGLPLTRKFIEIIGGKFNLQSEVGKGTAIVITLPKEVKSRNAFADA